MFIYVCLSTSLSLLKSIRSHLYIDNTHSRVGWTVKIANFYLEKLFTFIIFENAQFFNGEIREYMLLKKNNKKWRSKKFKIKSHNC